MIYRNVIRPPRRLHMIRLCTYEPCIITAEEYAAMKRDVEARFIAGCPEIGDRVLARLLVEHSPRYYEISRRSHDD
jgi:hypothetical protein